MSVAIGTLAGREHRVPAPSPRRRRESAAVRWTIVAIAVVFLTIFLVLPLAVVFMQAFFTASKNNSKSTVWFFCKYNK